MFRSPLIKTKIPKIPEWKFTSSPNLWRAARLNAPDYFQAGQRGHVNPSMRVGTTRPRLDLMRR